ncbi:HEAT repeat domain-containing protein [bacterium]|nr:HEAT repeat domain-containing protein [bacterium]
MNNNKPIKENSFREIAKELHLAISKIEMYGKGHPIPIQSVKISYDKIIKILKAEGSLSISLADDGVLFVNGLNLVNDNFSRLFYKDLLKKNVRSLNFDKNLKLDEFKVALVYFSQANSTGENLEIDNYFDLHGVKSIVANSIEYRKILGKKASSDFQQTKIPNLAPIAAKRVLDEISGLSPGILEYISENGLINTIADAFSKSDLDSVNHYIETLDGIIDKHRQQLSEDLGDELIVWYQKFKSKRVKQHLSKRRPETRKRLEFIDGIDNYLRMISRGIDTKESRRGLAALLTESIVATNIEDIEVLYSYLVATFKRFPTPGFLEVPEVLVSTLFLKSDFGLINTFAKNRISEKSRELNSSFETEFLTTTLVWLTTNYLEKRKLLSALVIAHLYNTRRNNVKLTNKLIQDANTFFASFCIGRPLEALVSATSAEMFTVPDEIKEFISLVNSTCIPRRFLEKMATESREYAFKIADALSVIPNKSTQVLVNEIIQVKSLQRDKAGRLISDIQRKKESQGMIVLAVIAGEDVLPLLSSLAKDTDSEIRYAVLEAIACIGTEKAIKQLVYLLYENSKNWCSDIVKLIPRLDPQIVVPILVRFFHSRRDNWIDIIRVVGNIKGEQSRIFLIDTLYIWNSYTSAMNSYEVEEFMMALLESIEKCDQNEETKRALRMFLSEWHNFDLLRGLKVVFGSRKDLVTEKTRSIISRSK